MGLPHTNIKKRKVRRVKKKTWIKVHRAKPATPTLIINALIGDEEQKKDKRKEDKEIRRKIN